MAIAFSLRFYAFVVSLTVADTPLRYQEGCAIRHENFLPLTYLLLVRSANGKKRGQDA
jgi:hypothetical protein